MAEKKNILILTQTFPTAGYTHHGVFVLCQVLELAKRDYNIAVLYPRALFPVVYKWLEKRKGKDFFVAKKIEGLLPDAIKFYFAPFVLFTRFGLGDFLKAASIFTYIKLKGIKMDLIHAHMAYNAGYLGVLLGRWLKKPVVVTSHGGDVNSLFMEEREIYRFHWGSENLEQVKQKVTTTLLECNKIIAVSNAVKERITKLGVSGEKVRVIYNGISLQKFYLGSQTEARPKLKLPNKKIILYVGSFLLKKGLFYLIEAIHSIKEKREDFLLVLIGDGRLKEELMAKVKSKQLEQNVMFTGPIPNNELPRWYAATDIFCLPSIQEPFGCVLIEAMACGKPIVATLVGGIPEIVNHPETGLLVPPKNAEKLAERLMLAMDKEWDAEFIHRASKRFHWPNIIPQIEAVYAEVLKNCATKT